MSDLGIVLCEADVRVIANLVAATLQVDRYGEWTDPVQPRFFNAIFRGLFGFAGDFWELPLEPVDARRIAQPDPTARRFAST